MVKEKIKLIGIAIIAFIVLLSSFEQSSSYPFLMAVVIIFAASLACFFAFMNRINRSWYIKVFITNAILIILLPIIEGIDFLFISVILLAILAFTQYAFMLLSKSK